MSNRKTVNPKLTLRMMHHAFALHFKSGVLIPNLFEQKLRGRGSGARRVRIPNFEYKSDPEFVWQIN